MYKLFILPTQETKEYLHKLLRDIPITVDYDALAVEVGSSPTPIQADLDRVYRALPGQLGIWYETAVGHSWIILPLIPSPEMCDRHEEIGDAWGRHFVPYMVLTGKFNNTSSVKPKLNSIATMLVDTLPDLTLTFTCETVVVDDSVVPSQEDFYLDYYSKGRSSRQLFLELTA